MIEMNGVVNVQLIILLGLLLLMVGCQRFWPRGYCITFSLAETGDTEEMMNNEAKRQKNQFNGLT